MILVRRRCLLLSKRLPGTLATGSSQQLSPHLFEHTWQWKALERCLDYLWSASSPSLCLPTQIEKHASRTPSPQCTYNWGWILSCCSTLHPHPCPASTKLLGLRTSQQPCTSQLLPHSKGRGCRGYRGCHRADVLGRLAHQLLPQQAPFPSLSLCSWDSPIHPFINGRHISRALPRHWVLGAANSNGSDQTGPASTDHSLEGSGRQANQGPK